MIMKSFKELSGKDGNLEILASGERLQGFPSGSVVNNLPAMQEMWVLEDPLEKEMATHSSILAQTIPWRDEPGRLQSTGHRVGHDWVTEHVLMSGHRETEPHHITECVQDTKHSLIKMSSFPSQVRWKSARSFFKPYNNSFN